MSQSSYIFLDEAGNLDFSPKGSRFFVLTSVSMRRPFLMYKFLDDHKYDYMEYGLNIEHFHCSEDNNRMRERIFNTISTHLNSIRIDSLVVEKNKTHPSMQEYKRFYPEMLGYLLKHVIPKEVGKATRDVIVITDTIPVKTKRKAIEKTIQIVLADMLRQRNCNAAHRILHHQSKSHYGLQVADYCCWAVYRKLQTGEIVFYNKIKPAVRSEFDIFRTGTTNHY